MKTSTLAGKKRVKFQVKADKGSEVYVAGTFNGWSPRKNKLKEKNGVYSTTTLISKGRHEYKFIINDIWCADPDCPEWTRNSHGSLNSVIVVG